MTETTNTATVPSERIRLNPPRGWHEDREGALACPHRDLSVCPPCAASTPEALESYGMHFWIADPADRATIAAEIASLGGAS